MYTCIINKMYKIQKELNKFESVQQSTSIPTNMYIYKKAVESGGHVSVCDFKQQSITKLKKMDK